MATVVNTTFKLKRGTAARWAELNLVLEQGEPGFVYDENRLKIGDGITPWNDLPYIDGKREVGNYLTVEDFPAIGDPAIIYKATKDKYIYQYNPETAAYEKLNESFRLDDIEIIDGGNA